MNFLAHAYLSFGDAELLTGNLISDFVKGKAQYTYPERIQKGIRLHRAIDTFTDAHDAIKEAANFFKTPYRLYSGPIVDVVFDHFLATDETIFSDISLLHFSNDVYRKLEQQAAHLPPSFARVFISMRTHNWLWNYRLKEGIERSLHGLIRRATYINDSSTAYYLFQQHYAALQDCYTRFMPAVKAFAKQQIEAAGR